MKRSALTRKTPLRHGGKRMKRSPLKPISEKRRATLPARERCRQAVLERDGGRCRAKLPGCWKFATEVHEPLPRGRGGDETDPAACIALCPACHRQIHDNPAWATANGWTVSGYAIKGRAA